VLSLSEQELTGVLHNEITKGSHLQTVSELVKSLLELSLLAQQVQLVFDDFGKSGRLPLLAVDSVYIEQPLIEIETRMAPVDQLTGLVTMESLKKSVVVLVVLDWKVEPQIQVAQVVNDGQVCRVCPQVLEEVNSVFL